MKTTITRSLLSTLLLALASFSAAAQWAPSGIMGAGPTDGCFTFSINGKAYVGGGSNGRSLYCFDSATQHWSSLGSAANGEIRGWAFAFAMNGKGYVGGGDTTGTFTECAEFWEYDPSNNQWTPMADFPGGVRDAMFSFVINDTAYAGGGFDGSNIWNDFWKYDAVNNQWTALNATPAGHILFPSTFVLNNKGYVAIGEVTTTTTETEVQSLWAYDPATGSWEQKHDFPGVARQAGFGFALGGYGYVGGGQAAYTIVFNDMYKYDPAHDSWTPAESITTQFPAWPVAFTFGSDAYVGTGVYFAPTALYGIDSFHKYTPSAATSVGNITGGKAVPPIYPNPAGQYIHLGTNSTQNTSIAICDITGHCIKTYTATPQNTYYIGDLPGGIYIVKTTTGAETTTQRFVKE